MTKRSPAPKPTPAEVQPNPVPAPKPRRSYTRHQPPSETVLALQSQILEWVSHRSQAQEELLRATSMQRSAQGAVAEAQERLQRVESEVQYRLVLIAQIEGKPQPQITTSFLPLTGGLAPAQAVTSITSVAPFRERARQTGEINSESAEDMRRAL